MADHLKLGVGGEGVERLSREAAVLEAARHPGVVELVGFSAEDGVAELRTAEVEGPTLSGGDRLPPDEVAGLAAALATTLADLHDAGVVHGAVEGSHVLLGATGPVLCGFGDAGVAGPGRQPSGDVADLCRMVLTLVDRGPVADAARALEREPGTARDVATAFKACVPTAALPGRSAPGAPDRLGELLRSGAGRRDRRRWPAARWLAAPLVVAAIAGVLVVRAAGGDPATAPPDVVSVEPSTTLATTPAPTAPTATLVWPPSTGPAPTVALGDHRFTIGSPGDVAIAGPFGCGGAAGAAAVLRPASGQVFVFTEAASPGHDTTGVEVATVVGGVGLVMGDPDADGCPDLLVEREGGAPVPVTLETKAAS